MAKEAIRKVIKVIGMIFPNPPSFSRSVVPAFFSTAPPERKRHDLYIVLLSIWNSPPAIPIGLPVPMPKTIYPTWLTAWYPRSLFISCWTRAIITAATMVMLPNTIKKVFMAKFIWKISSEILARKYMPRSLSREAGKNAATGVGLSSAASGTQVWNGIAPALANAPLARQR